MVERRWRQKVKNQLLKKQRSRQIHVSVRSWPLGVTIGLLIAACFVSSGLLAQSVPGFPKSAPNLDRFPQTPATPQPLPTTSPEITQPPTDLPNSPANAANSPLIPVRQILVLGSTILKPSEIEALTRMFLQREVTLDRLQTLADTITEIYVQRGYVTSRAVLAEQKISQGVVKIQVIEGTIARLEVRGLKRLKSTYVRHRLHLGRPFNQIQLEDQLRLLRSDPVITAIAAQLEPGRGLGESILTVTVQEARPIGGLISADNYSVPSVGAQRFSGLLTYRNPTGNGDELSLSLTRSQRGGSTLLDGSYRLPINPMNGTLQLRVAPSWSQIIESPFSALGIRSQAATYELSYRQPLLRSTQQELALSLGLTVQDGQTFLFQNTPFPFGLGPDAAGKSRTRVLKFGQDYVKRTGKGALALRSLFSVGLDLWGATVNRDPLPDGRFVSWLGQIQRLHRLGTNHLLTWQGEVQLTPDRVLPSQQFAIGGGQSVRGYRQSARSGDNGVRLMVEDKITLARSDVGAATVQIAPFLEAGGIWNRAGNPNRLPRQTWLASLGFGLIVEPNPRMSLRLDYGLPLVNLTDRGKNAQDYGFYFSAGYRF